MSSIISLREWIKCAVEAAGLANELFASSYYDPDSNNWASGTIRRSSAVSSNPYLNSALVIARSLADQLCEKVDENSGGHLPLSPAPGTDWADRVVVHLSNERHNIDDYTEDLQPLPFSSQRPSSDPKELQAMLNSVIPDLLSYTKNDDEEGASTCIADEVNNVPFHDVVRVEFSHSQNDELCSQISEMQRIYNLGLVFYELFSGGERPPEINTQNDTAESMRKHGVNEDDVDGEPLPLGRLSIFNDDDDVEGIFKNSDDCCPLLDVNDENLMSRKKRASSSNCTSNAISIEPLRQKGLYVSLCDLINNMLDIINVDFIKDETYRTMTDVRNDLQQMLDKPDRFLHDLDLEKLAITGLQLNEAVFGRKMDFTDLQNSYRRSISGENECAVIVGPSGIGKTVLANRLGSFASADGAFFLSGKFDQLQQMTPFSALASAFNEYCHRMSERGQSRHRQEVATKLRMALGGEAGHLLKVIPNLGLILGEGAGQYDDQDCANAQARIQYLLCLFVDVISRSSGAPIILFLDDLQWSDQASLSAIKQLLLFFSSKRQFFFLGSCREEGLLQQHSFGSMLTSIRQFGVHATVVTLACLDKNTTNTVVSDLLCLSPRLTRTLSDIIFQKSHGNPFFFSQLMISLCRDGLVRLSLSRRRWEWEEEKVQSLKLPDNVAALLSSNITRLPKEVQSALCTLSCFGARSDCVLIEALETKLGIPLTEPLQVAVAEGIVDKVDGKFSFGHDKLQEAAYNLIQAENRCLFHCQYGLALVQHALERLDDGMLFAAVSQINLGGRAAIEDPKQCVTVANLNFAAGIKAMEMSDFSLAYSFFDHGITFLPKRHWQEHYDLSLQLFEAAGKCALVKSDALSLKLVTDQIFKYAKRFEDKLNTMFNNVTALAYATQLPGSVAMAVTVLSQLGIELPESSESDFKINIERTKVLLRGFADEDLVDYKIMSDPSKIMAMKFLARLELSFQYIRPASAPSVTLKMIQLSIDHGMSPVSPIGFTYFGQHVATCGDIEEGCRYVKIARKLLDRIGSKEFAGEVIAMGSQLLHFVKPIQVTIELHHEGYTIAMGAGDMQGAMLNLAFYCGIAFWSTTKLIICKERFAWTCRLLDQHGHSNLLSHILPLLKMIQLLMGKTDQEDTSKSNGVAAQVEEILKNAKQISHTGSIAFNFQQMYIHFMFREFDNMKMFAERCFCVNNHNWIFHFPFTSQMFYGGIVACWVYRQTKDPTWAERGRSAKVTIKKWAESSHHNFQHKAYLLEAEEAFCNNDTDKAQLYYEMAVSSAREHQ
ncbi:hypothetical protein ACHAXA_011648 [Cyclostephanos tholiformis]|uniref:Orc1-like AAA ATPase domain-containing protein n=1 Tax=Cyclostephanos tholiformis TaxID=382380 RepID=A0ABD3SEY2_9STRA